MAKKEPKTREPKTEAQSQTAAERLKGLKIGASVYIIWLDSAFPGTERGWYTKDGLKAFFSEAIPLIESIGFIADIDEEQVILVSTRSMDIKRDKMAHPHSIPLGAIHSFTLISY